jgi:hypothetical protein
LVTDIKLTKQQITMTTNAGTKVIGMEGHVEGFGKVYYDPTMMANIIGLSAMAQKYRVTFDSEVENAFTVHTKTGVMKFAQTSDGLYANKPPKSYLDEVAAEKRMLPQSKSGNNNRRGISFLVTTLKENMKLFTKRQIDDAKRARKFYHIVGCPTIENLKHLLRQNLVKNCPITPADLDVAEKIYGPDIGKLKGKTTRKAPPRVKDDLVEIPRELKEKHHDLPLAMDILHINGMPILTAIDRTIRLRICIPLKNRTAEGLYRGLDQMFWHY